jgi:hypothetical protein
VNYLRGNGKIEAEGPVKSNQQVWRWRRDHDASNGKFVLEDVPPEPALIYDLLVTLTNLQPRTVGHFVMMGNLVVSRRSPRTNCATAAWPRTSRTLGSGPLVGVAMDW